MKNDSNKLLYYITTINSILVTRPNILCSLKYGWKITYQNTFNCDHIPCDLCKLCMYDGSCYEFMIQRSFGKIWHSLISNKFL